MAILATFTVKGNTEELLERYDAAMPRIVEISPSKPLSHGAVPSDGGIKIFDVWESEEALGDIAQNPRFHEVLQEAGLPEPEVEVAPVHRFNW
jgi:hypothetical protein